MWNIGSKVNSLYFSKEAGPYNKKRGVGVNMSPSFTDRLTRRAPRLPLGSSLKSKAVYMSAFALVSTSTAAAAVGILAIEERARMTTDLHEATRERSPHCHSNFKAKEYNWWR